MAPRKCLHFWGVFAICLRNKRAKRFINGLALFLLCVLVVIDTLSAGYGYALRPFNKIVDVLLEQLLVRADLQLPERVLAL